ncbi:MAG: hypothetical protein IKB98_03460 [Clostridia bacterium]|nr:hypothetical protein [Clostridia bacterium]
MKKLLYVFFAVLLLGIIVVGGYFIYDRYLKTEEKSNGLYFNDELLHSDNAKISLDCNSDNVFKVVFSEVGYDIKIMPNEDFSFTVDGEEKTFLSLSNLTDYFDVEYLAEGFSVKLSEDFSMQAFLESIYPDSETIIISNYSPEDFNFVLTVTSKTNEESISVLFKIINCNDLGIKLDKTEIFI